MRITLADYKYQPRDYQIPLWEAFDSGIKRLYTLWHRRSGKDLTWWNILIREGIKRKGLYYHFLPTAVQGRKVIWDGMTNDGIKFLDFIPKGAIKAVNSQEMKVTLFNDSILQVIGTDHYDSVRGTNPIGCVFSEHAYQHPMAWEVVKPILKANGGFAGFDTTPNGNNHAKEMWDRALENSKWYTSRLTVDDTNILTKADIQEERDDGMSAEMIEQEYYVSFDAGMVGAFYAPQVKAIKAEGRYCDIKPTDAPVDVFFDLGKSDTMAIGFLQNGTDVIDYYEGNLKDLDHYITILRERGYNYRTLYIPHDGFANRLESPRTVAEQFHDAGFNVEPVANISILNGIQLVRKMLKVLRFSKLPNKENIPATKILLSALESYKKEYDELKKVYKETPLHNWASHPSDMMRYMAVVFFGDRTTDIKDYQEAHKSVMKDPDEEETPEAYVKRLDEQMKNAMEGREMEDTYDNAHEEYLRSLN